MAVGSLNLNCEHQLTRPVLLTLEKTRYFIECSQHTTAVLVNVLVFAVLEHSPRFIQHLWKLFPLHQCVFPAAALRLVVFVVVHHSIVILPFYRFYSFFFIAFETH